MIDIRWYGRGGQGAFTAARLLGRIMSLYEGRCALAYPSFGPERRGAPVWCFTRIDDVKIIDRGQPGPCDYLIVLDDTLLLADTADVLKEDGVALINAPGRSRPDFIRQRTVLLDATGMAVDVLGRPITNIAMIGAFAAVSGIPSLAHAYDALREFFPPKLYEKNKILLQEAYNAVKKEA